MSPEERMELKTLESVTRKRRPRTCFARLKGIEHGGKVWSICLTKDGVKVHRRWAKKSEVFRVGLGQLINLALRQPELIPLPVAQPEAPHHD